ncbi:glutamyl aminopeptidase-like [Anopheles nili]|uniref:glutamyl aminopeptidase-like n=1 Tax=Anopheles nili TaxID=185578 RepID=UPI00237B2749|nr:glutamyl aminopeptidase-like [Anopheles nili]
MKNSLHLCTILPGLLLFVFSVVSESTFTSFRLPNHTVPTHYTLRLDTNFHRNTFEYTGNVQISINVVEPTNQIVLHSVRNVISRLQLRNCEGIAEKIINYKLDAEKEFLVITVVKMLTPNSGLHTLEIDFTNNIDRDDRAGFYKSSYENDQGVTRYLGLTDFEACDARSSFPCYDEPGIKTTYDILISCDPDYHVLSNAPVRRVKVLCDGRKLFTFSRTPRMQSYLVAWLVSDFVSERDVLTQPQLTISSWASPTSAKQLSYSVDNSKRLIRVMEEYFGVRYSMQKIDSVAIKSSDFTAGAMENWGLIMYRESAFLFDSETQNQRQQLRVANIIAHELTHQFFGNMLAPKWWSYLWLNEGFATFFSYYLGDVKSSEMPLRRQLITNVLQAAISGDGSANVRPMTYYAETPQDIAKLFDDVAYKKSASVIRMMQYVLGESTFRKGLHYYLKENKDNGVVEESNLYDSLEKAAKQDGVLPKGLSMNEIFESWSHQAGVPLVTIHREGNEYVFTQQRFFHELQKEPSHASWWIPISFATTNNTKYEILPAFWMHPNTSNTSYTIPASADEIVLFNPHAAGYYRIEYPENMMRSLVKQLETNTTAIEPAARARLIDDSLAIAHSKGGDYKMVFQLMSYLRREVDYEPWMVAHTHIRYLQAMLRSDENATQLLNSFVVKIASPLLKHYGYQQRSREFVLAEELRTIAIELACSANKACLTVAQLSVRNFLYSKRSHPAMINSGLVYIGLKQSDADLRQAYVEKVFINNNTNADPFIKQYVTKSFGCMGKNATLLRSYAKHIFELNDLDRQKALHRLIVASKVSLNDVLTTLESELSVHHRNTIHDTAIRKILLDLARFVIDPEEAKLLMSTVSTYASSSASDIEEQLMVNRKWICRNLIPLTDALRQFADS